MKKVKQQVAQEIISTEVFYLQGLNVLLQLYYQQIMNDKKKFGVPDEYFRDIFGSIPQIVSTHIEFCKALQDRWDQWSEKDCFGDIFKRFTPFFKMYTVYVNNHDVATNHLNKLLTERRYEQFQKFERTNTANPESNSLNLASLLITPIQRIPRYKLLLSELIKNTPEDHIDYPDLQEAIATVSEVALKINDALKIRENRENLVNIQESLVGNHPILTASRKFIRKGKLKRVTRSAHKSFQFFLFNDMLMYCSQQGWKFIVHRKIDIVRGIFAVERMSPDGEKHRMKVINSVKSFIVWSQIESEIES